MSQGAEIKERLDKYLSFKNYRRAAVERQAGLSNCYLKSSGGGFSAPKLADLAQVCTDLNMNWLITGQGEMLLTDSSALSYVEGDQININKSHGRTIIGKVVNENLKRSFFDVNQTVEKIEAIDIEVVPQKYLRLVQGVKERKKEIKKLKDDLLAAQSYIQDLAKELNQAKDELLSVYREQAKKSINS